MADCYVGDTSKRLPHGQLAVRAWRGAGSQLQPRQIAHATFDCEESVSKACSQPLRQAALLSGEGAAGKSIVLLHLCAAHALARDWLRTLPEPVLQCSSTRRTRPQSCTAVWRTSSTTTAPLRRCDQGRPSHDVLGRPGRRTCRPPSHRQDRTHSFVQALPSGRRRPQAEDDRNCLVGQRLCGQRDRPSTSPAISQLDDQARHRRERGCRTGHAPVADRQGGSSASRPRVAMVRAGDNAMPIAPSVAVWIGGLSWQVRRNAVAVSSLTT